MTAMTAMTVMMLEMIIPITAVRIMMKQQATVLSIVPSASWVSHMRGEWRDQILMIVQDW